MKLNASEKPLTIFVVEDDLWYGELLVHHLQLNPENKVKRFESGSDLLNALDENPHIITLDYSLPDIKGDKLLKIIKSKVPDAEIVIVSGQEDINTALTMMRVGVYDYIVKNEETKERLWNAVNHIRNKVSLEEEVKHLRSQIGDKSDLRNMIVGNSEQMNHVFNLISKATTTTINVSLTGETGTGKELVARAIHLNSSRANKPFVAVNATAIPRDLMESELFGHEKGSFTGAINTRIGKFEEANGGTLFLDEIADLDFSIQVKLLRVLQEREITRVGSNQIIPIDVRIITATHKNLSEEVRLGLFREDLFYRLLGLPIHLPPLKDRGNDILLLAKQFLDSFCSLNKLSRKSFSVAAKEKLLSYQYPGNVRELKAVVELAAVMTINDQIDVDDISFTATRTPVDLLDQDCTLDEFNCKIIRYYLDRYDNNVIETAKKLDIGKSTIYRLLKEGKL
ncbi:MAG: sigma-54-dependent Fis family transcriptional regulator [Bacteroidetes bacterium]|nr:sigma-54-dependent Fis family transcriptional regulator [Bacteroidota bacterium]